MTTTRTVGIATVLALVGAGCALGLIMRGPAPAISDDDLKKSDEHMKRARFDVMRDSSGKPSTFNRIRRVYVTGSGKHLPKVIVLHELPGLRDGDIEVGQALGNAFEIYMPLLFGEAGQDNGGLGDKQACKSGLFHCNDRNTQHPIATDLLAMTNQICGGAECGVVGMCLTGTLPLSLIHANTVVALVMAQPTLPLFLHVWPFNGLDISSADTKSAMDIAVQRRASIHMVRYRHDWISGRAAFNTLVDRIKPLEDKLSYFRAVEVKANGHSTLVHNKKHPDVAREQLQAIEAMLKQRLHVQPAPSPRN